MTCTVMDMFCLNLSLCYTIQYVISLSKIISLAPSKVGYMLQGQICLMEEISLKAITPSISQPAYSSTAQPFSPAVPQHFPFLFDELHFYASHYFTFKPGHFSCRLSPHRGNLFHVPGSIATRCISILNLTPSLTCNGAFQPGRPELKGNA